MSVEEQEKLLYLDMTDELQQVASQLSAWEFLSCKSFEMFEAMQASQVCEDKMDFKNDLCQMTTYDKLLSKGLVKECKEIDIEEMLFFYDQMCGLECQWLRGQAIGETVFTFVFMYDEGLLEGNGLLQVLVESCHLNGDMAFQYIRRTNSLNEDDYIICTFTFKDEGQQSYQNVLSLFQQQESLLIPFLTPVSKSKKDKKKQQSAPVMNVHDAMDVRLKFRRAWTELYKVMYQEFSFHSKESILKIVGEQEKRLKVIQETRHFYIDQEVDLQKAYYNQSIVKSINCMNNRRPFQSPSFSRMVQDMTEMHEQIKMVCEMSNESNFHDVLVKVKLFMERPRNILVHVYLDYQLFSCSFRYFTHESYQNLVTSMMLEYEPKLEEILSEERVANFIDKMSLVCVEYLGIYLRNPYRQRRAFTKIYHDISLIIHLGNQAQSNLKLNANLAQLPIELGLKMMTDQLTMGYTQELYSQIDFPFIVFYLEYIYGLQESNQKNWMHYPPQFKKHLEFKQLSKAKNSISPFLFNKFFQSILNKALYLYHRALARSLFFIVNQDLFHFSFSKDYQQLQIRFQNRFKIFQTVFFMKRIQLPEYIQSMEQDFKDDTSFKKKLDMIKAYFTEAKKSLEMLEGENVCPQYFKDYAVQLKRCIVLSSLQMTKLEMEHKNVENLRINNLVDINTQLSIPYLNLK